MKRFLPFIAVAVLCFATVKTAKAQIKVLFDATKSETAGNADWVVDADVHNLGYHAGVATAGSGSESNAQRIPTPAQSTVTANTTETYWEGALSSWGLDCVKRGYIVETLPYNAAITYGDTSNPQDLSNYNVYIVDEPNTRFTEAQKEAILNYVQHGGGLLMISDHKSSDRDGDGWDSPEVWGDFLNNNQIQNNPFGISFEEKDISLTSNYVHASATDSIINGPMGAVTEVEWSDGTVMMIDPIRNPSAKGVIYSINTNNEDTAAMVAYARYGQGRVAAMGDSSPADDGTGDPNDNSLYNGYTSDADGNHRRLLMNMTIWLANDYPTAINEVPARQTAVTIFPNPAVNTAFIKASNTLDNVTVVVTDVAGRTIARYGMEHLQAGVTMPVTLKQGFYFLRLNSDQLTDTYKLKIE